MRYNKLYKPLLLSIRGLLFIKIGIKSEKKVWENLTEK